MDPDEAANATGRSPARWWRRHRRRAVAVLLGTAILGVAAAKLAVDWPAKPSRVPQEVQDAAGVRTDLYGKAYVYVFWGNFIDSEYLWRVEVGRELIPVLTRQCGAVEVASAGDIPDAFWGQAPYWWRPPRTGPARYFASPGFVADARGRDGSYYLIVYDETEGVVYAWHKRNF